MPDLDLILLKIVFAANLGLFAIIWETEGKDTTTLPNSMKFTASVSPSSTIYPSTNLVSSSSSNMLITKSSTPRLIVGSTNSIESSTLDSKATMLYLTPSISELRTAAIKSSLPSPQQYITSPPNITGLFPSKSTPKIRPSESIVTRVSSFSVTSTIISTSSIVTKTATEKDTESTKQSTNGNEFTDENNGLVIGLSVGLGAAAMITLVSLVVIWKKYKRDMSCSATSSKSTRSPATTSNAVIADDDEVAEQESTSNDKYRLRTSIMKKLDTVDDTIQKISSEDPKEQPKKSSEKQKERPKNSADKPKEHPRERTAVTSNFSEFKRSKVQERKKRMEEAVAQKRDLYIKPSREKHES